MRTVVISGASGGIGLATAKRFVGAGDFVVNLDVREPDPEAAETAGATTAILARPAVTPVERSRSRVFHDPESVR